MNNVILPRQYYQEFRLYLHKTDILYRDCNQCVIIPDWQECVANQEICYERRTASEIAYTSLKTHYPDVSLKWREEELRFLEAYAPQVFKGQYSGELYYIDIKSAHAQFYQYLYLHSEWPYKRQKFPLFNVAQELWEKKIARNAVVGICRSTQDKWVKGPEVWYKDKVNHFLSPTLWAQIAGILNQVAVQMLKTGAIWINTDGYLFGTEKQYRRAIHWLLDQDITIAHGAGYGYIKALQNIRVEGVKELKSQDVGKKPIHNIQMDFLDHLSEWRKNRERLQREL